MTIETWAAPLDGWLVCLALGWRLPCPLDAPLAHCGHDGAYCVRMWRAAA